MFEQINEYFYSVDAKWHLACVAAGVINQIFVVRYIVFMVRTASLGLWPLRGALALFALALNKLIYDSGYGADLGLALVVVFCADLFFLGSGILPPNAAQGSGDRTKDDN